MTGRKELTQGLLSGKQKGKELSWWERAKISYAKITAEQPAIIRKLSPTEPSDAPSNSSTPATTRSTKQLENKATIRPLNQNTPAEAQPSSSIASPKKLSSEDKDAASPRVLTQNTSTAAPTVLVDIAPAPADVPKKENVLDLIRKIEEHKNYESLKYRDLLNNLFLNVRAIAQNQNKLEKIESLEALYKAIVANQQELKNEIEALKKEFHYSYDKSTLLAKATALLNTKLSSLRLKPDNSNQVEGKASRSDIRLLNTFTRLIVEKEIPNPIQSQIPLTSEMDMEFFKLLFGELESQHHELVANLRQKMRAEAQAKEALAKEAQRQNELRAEEERQRQLQEAEKARLLEQHQATLAAASAPDFLTSAASPSRMPEIKEETFSILTLSIQVMRVLGEVTSIKLKDHEDFNAHTAAEILSKLNIMLLTLQTSEVQITAMPFLKPTKKANLPELIGWANTITKLVLPHIPKEAPKHQPQPSQSDFVPETEDKTRPIERSDSVTVVDNHRRRSTLEIDSSVQPKANEDKQPAGIPPSHTFQLPRQQSSLKPLPPKPQQKSFMDRHPWLAATGFVLGNILVWGTIVAVGFLCPPAGAAMAAGAAKLYAMGWGGYTALALSSAAITATSGGIGYAAASGLEGCCSSQPTPGYKKTKMKHKPPAEGYVPPVYRPTTGNTSNIMSTTGQPSIQQSSTEKPTPGRGKPVSYPQRPKPAIDSSTPSNANSKSFGKK